ncbi:Glu/Leu/Phe/Val dehydrogenase dimerization domain-containing protein [Mycolicibacterium goodii]|uniref:Glu/Leu/Phe/Val dehydrogenase dimerization domain-containing protein n=1 Tax=Mycolicibacterium goodii TaxID=134601 RepID=UPI000C26A3C7|nr:hypothetical protein CSX11_32275 [Mycolicibacterium goodii]
MAAILDQTDVSTVADPLTEAQTELVAPLHVLGHDNGVARLLGTPRREVIMSIPRRHDDEPSDVPTPYRLHLTLFRNPATAGLRCAPQVNLDEVGAWAKWRTWKCVRLDTPYGGAKDGMRIETAQYPQSGRGLSRAAMSLISVLSSVLNGKFRHLASAPANATMARVVDTFSLQGGDTVLGVATGRPLGLGGSQGHHAARFLGRSRYPGDRSQRRARCGGNAILGSISVRWRNTWTHVGGRGDRRRLPNRAIRRSSYSKRTYWACAVEGTTDAQNAGCVGDRRRRQ